MPYILFIANEKTINSFKTHESIGPSQAFAIFCVMFGCDFQNNLVTKNYSTGIVDNCIIDFRTNRPQANGPQYKWAPNNWALDKWSPDKCAPDKRAPDIWSPEQMGPGPMSTGQIGTGQMCTRRMDPKTNGWRTFGPIKLAWTKDIICY